MRRWLWIVLVVTQTACGDDDGMPWQARAAERVRELPLLDTVEIQRFTREEYAARAAENAQEISDETLQYYADTYGRMGFFDPTLDLRRVFAGSSSDWVGATYSPNANLITLVGDARDDTIVHEFVHALQDDHFGIAQYDLATSDGFMARRSVVEGDAVVAQYRFLAQQDLDTELDGVNWASVLQSRRDYSAATLADAAYPVLFLDYVSLVYTYGFEYMAHNLLGVSYDQPTEVAPAPHDWERANQMYTERVPDTTEQILRLDLLDGAAAVDPVVDVGVQTVPAVVADRLEAVDWDRLGRWYTYLLLYPLEETGVDAWSLAATWDGDSVLFVRDLETGAAGVLWIAEWDDDTAAANIAGALWDLHGYTAIEGEAEYIGTTDSGEIAWIEQRANRTVMAINIDLAVASPLIDAAVTGEAMRVARRFPSLAETISHRSSAGHHRACALLPPQVRQRLSGVVASRKK